jgi:SAM-dependent methyltransferase
MSRAGDDPEAWADILQGHPLGDVWETLLFLQSEFLLEEDLRFFFNDPLWKGARKVLDFGCGPGDLIGTLDDYFPDKDYTGVDLSEGYIRAAAARFGGKGNVRFIRQDVYEYAGPRYDYIILRLVLQHLADPDKLLSRLHDLLEPGGCVLVVDSADRLRLVEPDVPLLKEMYRQLQELQKAKGGDREAARKAEEAAPRLSYRVLRSEVVAAPAIRPEDQDTLVKLYAMASQVVRQKFGVAIDPVEFIRQLMDWKRRPYSYAQIGVHHLLLG